LPEAGGWGRTSSSCSGSGFSAPPSFKAGKPRKTKDFIGSARKENETGWAGPSSSFSGQPRELLLDVDPRLLDDTDAQPITAKVASLIYHYIEEGNSSMLQGPENDEFHEVHFVSRRCCGCCPRRYSTPTASVDGVFGLINDVANSLYFCKQVVVLCAVYVERLLHEETSVILTDGNWRSVVVVGLLIASKVWEDVHPWNADFEDCLSEIAGLRYRHGALYHLESLFLDKLRWHVHVDGEVYAAYFFSLVEGSRPGTAVPPQRQMRPRMHTDTFQIETIMEDDMYFSVNETDLERATSNERHSLCIMPTNCILEADRESSASSLTPPGSPTLAQLPWSREELATNWRRKVLEQGDWGESSGARLRAVRDAWKLDQNNPHVGSLRHAPRALAPSSRIAHSANLLWEHQLTRRTTDLLGPPTPRGKEGTDTSGKAPAAHTLSGATGAELASELRRYLDRKDSSSLV